MLLLPFKYSAIHLVLRHSFSTPTPTSKYSDSDLSTLNPILLLFEYWGTPSPFHFPKSIPAFTIVVLTLIFIRCDAALASWNLLVLHLPLSSTPTPPPHPSSPSNTPTLSQVLEPSYLKYLNSLLYILFESSPAILLVGSLYIYIYIYTYIYIYIYIYIHTYIYVYMYIY